MPIEITMPRLSDTMEEGTLVSWKVEVGDEVSSGDHLADVETDKATMELQAFDDGKVAKLAIDEGATVAVGKLILVLAEDGESVEDAAAHAGNGTEDSGKADDDKGGKARDDSGDPSSAEPASAGVESQPASAGVPSQPQPDESPASDTRIRISPLASKIAQEKGLDVSQIQGTGPGGRIIKRDVLKAAEGGQAAPTGGKPAPAPPPAAAPAGLDSKRITLSGMRKTIAKRLIESKTTIPHFQVSVSVNMDPLMDLRKTLNEQLEPQGVKLSVNDFIARAIALACVQVPTVNSSWAGDAIEQHGTVNLGIAVALPEEKGGGLIVPVLRGVETKGLRQISQETRAIARKARESGLTAEEMADGTITLSNLGMYGVDQFNAIINPPQAAIVAVGGANRKAIVRDIDGTPTLTIGHEMSATISADHRVVDGAIAAEYLTALRGLLENPATLLV